MNDEFVSIEHLVLAILTLKGPNIKRSNRKGLKAAIDELRKGERVTSASAEERRIIL
jgi:ATP-dependent Clp protease ATP-binding subunit ClpB